MNGSLTLDIDHELLDALDHIAQRTEISRERLAAQAIADYVALQDWHITRIEAGIAAADRGDFATDEEVARLRAKFAAPA